MVDLSVIFLVGILKKYGLLELKLRLLCRFKLMSCSRVSSICVGIVRLLLMKCRQGLSNCIKKSSLLCFCKFLCLINPKDLFLSE